MAVIRIEKTKNYTVMSNYHLRDTNLSLKAKGLLSIMLSLPDGWHYSIRGLASICKEGITSISSTLKELETNGYMKRYQPTSNGKFLEIEYIIYETPQADLVQDKPTSNDMPETLYEDAVPVMPSHSSYPGTVSPCTQNPHTVNPNTEISNSADTDSANHHAYKVLNNPNTERANTDMINYPSINQPNDPVKMDRWMGAPSHTYTNQSAPDRSPTAIRENYRHLIMKNISYDDLCTAYPFQKEFLSGIVDIMTDAVCSTAPTLRIDKEDIPQEVVKARLLKLTYNHIDYVIHCFSEQHQKIQRLDRYLLTMLYKAPATMDSYYANWVRSDQYL